MRALMIDALGSGKGTRQLTRDVIGCGPRLICGLLESRGVECRIQLAEDFLKRSRKVDFDLILVSAMTMDLKALKKIGRKCRRIATSSKMILGGPVALTPKRALNFSGFDLAVVGEGELAIESIMDGENPEEIDGVVTKEQEAFRYFLPDRLDESRYREYFPSTERIVDYPTHFASRVYVEVVRGCSNFNRTIIELPDGRKCSNCTEGCGLADCPQGIPPGCGFCSVPATFGPPKSREVEPVALEVKQLVKLGVRRIVLSAPDILDYQRGKDLRDPRQPKPNYRMLDSLFSKAVQAAGGEANISIENVKPSLFDNGVASIISKNLPGSSVHIGCETGDPEHSRELGRPATPSETLKAVRIAKSHGLKPYVYFIHGLPGQTIERARKTAGLIRTLGPLVSKITTYRFKPLPSSAFAQFGTGPPSRMDEASNIISEATREVNLEKKRLYVQELVDAVVAERNMVKRNQMIAFPITGGPIVTFQGDVSMIAKRVKLKIRKVISDRLLFGELKEIIDD